MRTITLSQSERFTLLGKTVRFLAMPDGVTDSSFVSCYSTSRKDYRGYIAAITPSSSAALANIIEDRK